MRMHVLNTQRGIINVETKEQAQRMICATAMVMESTIEDLRNNETIQGLAEAFNIKTDKIIMTPNDNHMDFSHTFSFDIDEFIESNKDLPTHDIELPF